MNKTLIVVVLLLVFVGGGVLLLNNQQGKTNEASSNIPAMDPSASSGQGENPSQESRLDNNSKYVEYSKDVFDRSKSTRRVLFFYASWCPICIPADADFKANVNKFPEDLVLIRVNYNDPETDQDEKDLAKKYAVTYQHTFVQIDSEGAEVTKWNGGQTEELLENLE